MSKKRKIISLAVLGVLLLASLALSLLLGKGGQQVLLLHRVVGIFHRDALCSLQSLTGFLCHLFDVHSAYLLSCR